MAAAKKEPIDQETPVEETPVEDKPAPDPERKVTVIVPRIKKEEPDCYVNINGKSWLIKRGVHVEVPWYVAELIQNNELTRMEAEEYEERMTRAD